MSASSRPLLWLAAALVPLAVLALAWPSGSSRPAAPAIRAITLDAPGTPEPGTLDDLQALGITHITLISFGYQSAKDEPAIRHNPNPRWYSESDTGIRALAASARERGMGIILKPHLWLSGGAWRAEIGFAEEADWQSWQADYRRFLMYYAHLAADLDAEMLVIGTELSHCVRTRPDFWRSLIAEVRTVYDGPLTYAANWYEEYEHIAFWDDLDYIGVQAYFPLTEAENPDLEALVAGWQPHAEALERLHRKTGKPILFTEAGYRSIGYAAHEPWRWATRDEMATTPPDPELQARLYEALFQRFWQEDWFAGVILWKWNAGSRRRGNSRSVIDFTPQGKPAEQTIQQWFTR